MRHPDPHFEPSDPSAAMLGMLVHRAVFMPLQRPHYRLHLIEPHRYVAAANETAQRISKWAKSDYPAKKWGPFECMLDSGGPWWGGNRSRWHDLTTLDQDWVLERVPLATATAAGAIAEDAKQNWWLWAWGEHVLLERRTPRDVFHRCDLLVGRRDTDLVIDLKVTPHQETDDDRATMGGYVRLVRKREQRPVEGWFLVVRPDGKSYSWRRWDG
jgi:hypothetical protein